MTDSIRFPRGLYGITPEWDDTDRLLHAIDQAARGGMVALQWRRKHLDAAQGLAQARRIQDHCRQLGVLCIINDDWRLAAMIDADGVHVGRDDGTIADARLALGDDRIVGSSCYSDIERARQAIDAGVDYIAFGAVYPSPIKPDAVRVPLEVITQARALVENITPAGERRVAICAIGGITPGNAAPVVAAGADSLALISGLFEAPDIRAAAAACQALYA
ncbi:MAG: thiamine phosphate synthase [Castellaniella sp.]